KKKKNRVKALERRVSELMGFSHLIALSGQTYSRKIDYEIVSTMAGVAHSAHKMCTDIRLLASFQELEEPFESTQVGSSAMAYKRNPMRSERVCSLARYVGGFAQPIGETHSIQWMERSLDDSAIRRMILPETFLGIDAILDISHNIIDGITVWPKVIDRVLFCFFLKKKNYNKINLNQ
ncbi:adenylosuccinate lyase, partial [Reticulomyxa filosa]